MHAWRERERETRNELQQRHLRLAKLSKRRKKKSQHFKHFSTTNSNVHLQIQPHSSLGNSYKLAILALPERRGLYVCVCTQITSLLITLCFLFYPHLSISTSSRYGEQRQGKNHCGHNRLVLPSTRPSPLSFIDSFIHFPMITIILNFSYYL